MNYPEKWKGNQMIYDIIYKMKIKYDYQWINYPWNEVDVRNIGLKQWEKSILYSPLSNTQHEKYKMAGLNLFVGTQSSP